MPLTAHDSLRSARGQGAQMNAVVGALLALVLLCLGAPTLAETRVALVIGNSAYKYAPVLPNPKHDAEGMAAALKRLDFEVLAGTDLAKPAMDKLLQAFADKLEKADVALVFYAGHGLQVNGHNYLVPIDGKLDKESDLVFQAVSLDTIQGLMEQSQRTNIMILDACRDNPLARNLARSMGTRSTGIGRGLGETKAGIGTLIVYATQPGNVALDGEGANSPFTAALLAHLETKGLEVRQVLTRVRQAVIANTKGKQAPWDSSSLTGDFFFVAAPAARETPPAPGSTPAPQPPQADSENLYWQSIKDRKNAADYKAYLEQYPNGTFASLAKIRIAELEKAADVTPPTPETPKPAPPAAARRTSTAETGIQITGTSIATIAKVPSVLACQSHCLRRANCVAWEYTTAEWQGPARLSCQLFSAVAQRGSTALKGIVSGVIRATAAPEQTAPKASPSPSTPTGPGGRTSSFEPNIYVSGGTHLGGGNAASPEACRSSCLNNLECSAWYHRANPTMCFLIRGGPISRTRNDFEPSARFVSGVIRTAQAAADSAKRRAAPFPADRQGQTRELMRRAEANENEEGFCGRVGWPTHPWTLPTNATPPTGLVVGVSARDCAVTRYQPVQHPRFGACVRSTYWRCERGGPCNAATQHPSYFCRGTDGYWLPQFGLSD